MVSDVIETPYKLCHNFNNVRVRVFILNGAPFAYKTMNICVVDLFARDGRHGDRRNAPAARSCLGGRDLRMTHFSSVDLRTRVKARRAAGTFSGRQAMMALRSSTPGSSTIHEFSSDPESLAAIRSAIGSMSCETKAFITMQPRGANRARIASQVHWSNSVAKENP